MEFKPKTKESMTFWHLVLSNFAQPIIVILCSAILWMGNLYLEEARLWRKQMDTRVTEVEKHTEKLFVGVDKRVSILEDRQRTYFKSDN